MRIELATSDEEVDRLLALAEEVWGAPPVSRPIARALSLAGWYVAGAYADDDPDGSGPSAGAGLVGMCAGMVGVHDDHLHLHSHLAAVTPAARGTGVGRALKRHQRGWCLAHGIETVSWTFDPLVRENARFNLHHLGAVGDRYLVDLYGAMDDEINRGHPSDRLLVRWDLGSPRTLDALEAPLPVVEGAGERRIRVETPEDIATLRRRDPDAALDWRMRVRDQMTEAFARGLRAIGLDATGAYVLGEAA